jgi:hypothetical protein
VGFQTKSKETTQDCQKTTAKFSVALQTLLVGGVLGNHLVAVTPDVVLVPV